MLVLHVHPSVLTCHQLDLRKVLHISEELVGVVIENDELRTRIGHDRIRVLEREKWRDDLNVGTTVQYSAKDTIYYCVVVKREDDIVTLQPFGTSSHIEVNVHSYFINESAFQFGDDFTEVPPQEDHEYLHATLAANDSSWRGVVIDTDVNFQICLVRKYGRLRHPSEDSHSANHMWLPLSYLQEHTTVERKLPKTFTQNNVLNKEPIKIKKNEEGFKTYFPWSTLQDLHAQGDDEMIIGHVMHAILKKIDWKDDDPLHKMFQMLLLACKMHTRDQYHFQLPHYDAIELSRGFFPRSLEEVHTVVKNILKLRLQASIFEDSPRDLVNESMTRFFNIMDPRNFSLYVRNLQYDGYKNLRKSISVKIVDVTDTDMSINIVYHGEPYPGIGSSFRMNKVAQCIRELAFVLQDYPKIRFPQCRGRVPSHYTDALDNCSEWYQKDVFYEGSLCANVTLFRYQSMAIAQMIEREDKDAGLSTIFEQNLNGMSYNMWSGPHNGASRVEKSSGGILVMDVGLGKTLCVLGLYDARPMKTLIVLPLTLMDEWAKQIRRYLPNVKLTECYGRKKDISGDIVLTTYTTVRTLFRQDELYVYLTGFERVVFDESHTLPGSDAMITCACDFIRAPKRWCLTATPFKTNNFKSLESQLKVLHVSPFNLYNRNTSLYFDFDFDNDIAIYSTRERALVQYTMTSTMIRISKNGLKLHDIPYKHVDVTHQIINCSYDGQNSLYEGHQKLFYLFVEHLVNMHGYYRYSQLSLFVDLLQTYTVHPSLVPLHYFAHSIESNSNVQTIQAVSEKMGDTAYAEEVRKTLDNLHETQCVICMDTFDRPTITPCCHLFCHDCITQHLSFRSNCPMCRKNIRSSALVELSNKQEEEVKVCGDDALFKDMFGRTCKIDRLMYAQWNEWNQKLTDTPKLAAIRKLVETTTKSIVIFSKFKSVLMLLKKIFSNAEIITGQSTRKQRKRAIENFQSGTSRIFILSVKCASVGITLTSGSHLVFMEELMDDTVKSQAIGRLVRTGQQSNVTVLTLSAPSSFDPGIASLRERLSTDNPSTSEANHRRKQRSTRTRGLLNLFGIM